MKNFLIKILALAMFLAPISLMSACKEEPKESDKGDKGAAASSEITESEQEAETTLEATEYENADAGDSEEKKEEEQMQGGATGLKGKPTAEDFDEHGNLKLEKLFEGVAKIYEKAAGADSEKPFEYRDDLFDKVQAADEASRAFALKMLGDKDKRKDNYVYSPISAWLCFSMYGAGLLGEGAEQLAKQVLPEGANFKDNAEVAEYISQLLQKSTYGQDEGIELPVAGDEHQDRPIIINEEDGEAVEGAEPVEPVEGAEPVEPEAAEGAEGDEGADLEILGEAAAEISEEVAEKAAEVGEKVSKAAEKAAEVVEEAAEKAGDAIEAGIPIKDDKRAKSLFFSENVAFTLDKLGFGEDFAKIATDHFDAKLFDVNFDDPAKRDLFAEKMNAWVNERSNGLIDKLYEDGKSIDPNMALALFNLVYFNGNWLKPFNKDFTEKEDFAGKSGTSKVDMMHAEDEYEYGEDEEGRYLGIPYENNAKIIFYLPKDEKKDISEYADKFFGMGNQEISQLMGFSKGRIGIPKFETQSDFELLKELRKLSIDAALAGPSLEGFFAKGAAQRLEVGDAFQKAAIKLDEQGTEAAAVTGIEMRLTSMPVDEKPFEMILDRPFLYKIVSFDTTLFMGQVSDLSE